MGRATSLAPQDIFLLDQWGRQLQEAFGETPYLVGSAARAEPYRDVDVRVLYPLGLRGRAHARRTLNVALTLWGRQVTGLPIDFQFQMPEEFHQHDEQVRNPLGGRSAAWASE